MKSEILKSFEVKKTYGMTNLWSYFMINVPSAHSLGLEIKPNHEFKIKLKGSKNTFKLLAWEHLNYEFGTDSLSTLSAYVVPGCKNDYAMVFHTIYSYITVYRDGNDAIIRIFNKADIPASFEPPVVTPLRLVTKERTEAIMHVVHVPNALRKLDIILGFSGEVKGFEWKHAEHFKSQN